MIHNDRGFIGIEGEADIVLAETAGLINGLVDAFDGDRRLILDAVTLGLDRNYGDTDAMMKRIYKMLDDRGYERKEGR